MDPAVMMRLDSGIRSLKRELASKGVFENAGRRQREEFRQWLDGDSGVGYPASSAALGMFDRDVELAIDAFIADRDRKDHS